MKQRNTMQCHSIAIQCHTIVTQSDFKLSWVLKSEVNVQGRDVAKLPWLQKKR